MARKPKLNVSKEQDTPQLLPESAKSLKMEAVVVVPSVHTLLTDAQSIVGNELSRLKRIQAVQDGLSTDQTLQTARYVKALRELLAEERIQDGLSDVDRLTDEELLEALTEAEEVVDAIRNKLSRGKKRSKKK